jgi:hypothetical protein
MDCKLFSLENYERKATDLPVMSRHGAPRVSRPFLKKVALNTWPACFQRTSPIEDSRRVFAVLSNTFSWHPKTVFSPSQPCASR